MLRYFTRRLGAMVITILLTSVIIFVMAEVVPVDPARSILGQYTTPEAVAQMRVKLGLDQPVATRYLNWLRKVLMGDLGESWQMGVPITPLLKIRFRNSLVLAAFALVLIVPTALAGGIIAGLNENKASDVIISIFGLFTTSLPEFVTATILILIFSWWLRVLPGSSMLQNEAGNPLLELDRLILPSMTLAIGQFGYLSRITKVSFAKVMKSDYIRTAILKGMTKTQVVLRHALQNALLAPITVVTTNLGWMIGGLIIIENVFAYPGLGRMMAGAAQFNDVPMLEASTLLGVSFAVGSQLLADILYALLNPQIRYK